MGTAAASGPLKPARVAHSRAPNCGVRGFLHIRTGKRPLRLEPSVYPWTRDPSRHADIRGVILGRSCNVQRALLLLRSCVLLDALTARFGLESVLPPRWVNCCCY